MALGGDQGDPAISDNGEQALRGGLAGCLKIKVRLTLQLADGLFKGTFFLHREGADEREGAAGEDVADILQFSAEDLGKADQRAGGKDAQHTEYDGENHGFFCNVFCRRLCVCKALLQAQQFFLGFGGE